MSSQPQQPQQQHQNHPSTNNNGHKKRGGLNVPKARQQQIPLAVPKPVNLPSIRKEHESSFSATGTTSVDSTSHSSANAGNVWDKKVPEETINVNNTSNDLEWASIVDASGTELGTDSIAMVEEAKNFFAQQNVPKPSTFISEVKPKQLTTNSAQHHRGEELEKKPWQSKKETSESEKIDSSVALEQKAIMAELAEKAKLRREAEEHEREESRRRALARAQELAKNSKKTSLPVSDTAEVPQPAVMKRKLTENSYESKNLQKQESKMGKTTEELVGMINDLSKNLVQISIHKSSPSENEDKNLSARAPVKSTHVKSKKQMSLNSSDLFSRFDFEFKNFLEAQAHAKKSKNCKTVALNSLDLLGKFSTLTAGLSLANLSPIVPNFSYPGFIAIPPDSSMPFPVPPWYPMYPPGPFYPAMPPSFQQGMFPAHMIPPPMPPNFSVYPWDQNNNPRPEFWRVEAMNFNPQYQPNYSKPYRGRGRGRFVRDFSPTKDKT